MEWSTFVNPLRAKDVYISPSCTLRATTGHVFRAYQERIYASLAVGKTIAQLAKGFKVDALTLQV